MGAESEVQMFVDMVCGEKNKVQEDENVIVLKGADGENNVTASITETY